MSEYDTGRMVAIGGAPREDLTEVAQSLGGRWHVLENVSASSGISECRQIQPYHQRGCDCCCGVRHQQRFAWSALPDQPCRDNIGADIGGELGGVNLMKQVSSSIHRPGPPREIADIE
ncbi:hypothetical protein ACQP1O_19100 [Nocardia sp. CA-151230]|uniref:hypothetical protein n=1 Tax=Nocardia sp. CA-151230 TaxID=3239982 RepID=UPI003D8C7934